MDVVSILREVEVEDPVLRLRHEPKCGDLLGPSRQFGIKFLSGKPKEMNYPRIWASGFRIRPFRMTGLLLLYAYSRFQPQPGLHALGSRIDGCMSLSSFFL